MSAEAWTALAQAAGAGIVQAAGTDVWASVRRRVEGVFGRGDAGHRQAVDRLDRTAAALEADRGREAVVRQEASWQERVERLLEDLEDDTERERVAAELRALVAEVEQARGGAGGGAMSGNTFSGPTAFQAGSGNRQFNHFGS